MKDQIDISTISAKRLEKLIEKANQKGLILNQEMIDAGRGHEKYNETINKAKLDSPDNLTLRFAEHMLYCQNLLNERDYRKQYHGNLKPVKKL